ncbi:hypothetical protein QAD02_003968 [Eretmocerus hayati]|uniref:Uncharacterized protein n=1 Tax=Eretmocerus hayati TaxID=131215 RepID=A0ACC2NPF8_9HYME|nr:hypothetical protein QAD02_003968 [Eretmocerus hayati]
MSAEDTWPTDVIGILAMPPSRLPIAARLAPLWRPSGLAGARFISSSLHPPLLMVLPLLPLPLTMPICSVVTPPQCPSADGPATHYKVGARPLFSMSILRVELGALDYIDRHQGKDDLLPSY